MSILNQPFPHDRNLKNQIRSAIVSGILVWIFLRIFQPFGLAEVGEKINTASFLYGCVTTLCLLINAGVQMLIPELYEEKSWTVGKNILHYTFILFLIGTGNFLLTVNQFNYPANFLTFLNFQYFTLVVGLVIVSALTMIRYFRLLKHYQAGAKELEVTLSGQHPADNAEPQTTKSIAGKRVILLSENEKEKVELPADQILYIESADNYSKLIFLEKEKIRTSIIRSSLKKIESQLPSGFFRCHRSYIVRLDRIKHVSGNSQGYRLHFEYWPESIPVARGSGKDLHQMLRQIKMVD